MDYLSPLEQSASFSPLEQSIGNQAYSPEWIDAVASSYSPHDVLPGSAINPYGDIVSPYGVNVGTIDTYDQIRTPDGVNLGWLDSYGGVRTSDGGTVGQLDAHGVIQPTYGW